jgi:replicative DNA helicase
MALDYKKLPHNLEAEQAVLGAMILDKDAVIDVVDIVNKDDFYRDTHQYIFMSIIELFNRNVSIDMVTLSDELNRIGKLDSVGGLDYLTELTSAGLITSHARSYAKIIEEKSMIRKLIVASADIVDKGYGKEDSSELLEFAEQSIFDISQKKNKDGLVEIKDILPQALEEIEMISKNPDALTGISTGFYDVDDITNGMHKSDLILVAARPSMGKTAFAVNICQHAAVMEKKSVAIFSLEMAKEQLVQRMLSSQALIPIQNIRTGKLRETDWPVLAKAMGVLSNAKIFIDDTPGITVMEMRAKSRRLKIEHGLDMIMVDYMQLMNSNSGRENRQQEISAISRGLKGLAREMGCPVLALSQLSRAPEMRNNKRPILSDLRESGAIEQDADIVMFLYRDEYYDKETEKKNIGEVIVSKQRNGRTGSVELTWLGEYTRFASLEKSRDM